MCIDVQTVHVLCYSNKDISTELGIHLSIMLPVNTCSLYFPSKYMTSLFSCLEVMRISLNTKVKGCHFIS